MTADVSVPGGLCPAPARSLDGANAHTTDLDARLEEATRRLGGDERRRARIVGDAQVLLLRLDAAAAAYERAGDAAALARLLGLAVRFGRYRLVRKLRPRVPAGAALAGAAWQRFLWERALPCVTMGGDVTRGFWVDEEQVGAIAGELGETVGAALARTVRFMLARGSRHTAKLYVFARLSGDPDLRRAVEPAFEARAAYPRARLLADVEAHLHARGGRVVRVLQAGDADDYNPLSAQLWEAELGGRRVVLKEHLRLPIDYARVDGYSAEKELLASVSHPRVVRLRESFTVRHHELLVLEHAAGYGLERHAVAGGLLPPGEALGLAATVAGVLAHLHAAGIVYADVKPRNLLYDGRALTLLDFGMAQRLQPGRATVTALLSTPAYVPPELAQRFEAGPAADLFQLGLMTCELLAGRHPCARGAGAAGEDDRERQLLTYALGNLWQEPDLGGPELDRPGLRALLGRMLDRHPERRPPATEVGAALRRMASDA